MKTLIFLVFAFSTFLVKAEQLENEFGNMKETNKMKSVQISELVSDSLALVALYNATDGPNWRNNTNWLTDAPVKDWYGVTVTNGRVTELSLSDWYNKFGLTGNLPAEMGNLSRLKVLVLDNNNLSGNIPVELGNLSELTALSLGDNNLTGNIPVDLGKLIKLSQLKLSSNDLTGEIPAEYNSLTELTYIDIANNNFSGSLPVEWGKLTNLGPLMISNNSFLFVDIEKIYNWENFATIDLTCHGQQVGTEKHLSASVGDSVTLTIDGYIPSSSDQYQWYFYGRPIDGADDLMYSIPKLSTVHEGYYTCYIKNSTVTGFTIESKDIHLNVNYVISETDSLALVAFYHATNGDLWIKNDNWLTSKVEEWHGVDLVDGYVTSLYLWSNNLTGNLPPEIGNLKYLNYLNLSSNMIEGMIPSQIVNLIHLGYLDLFNNKLEGTIPQEIGNLNSLSKLNLGSNKFTGTLPAEIGNLKKLEEIGLYDNELSGNIPSELFNLSELKEIILDNNRFTGGIPADLTGLTKLEFLSIKQNLIDSLPDLLIPSSLLELNVMDNKLTFEDLEYNMDLMLEFLYSYQKPFGKKDTIYVNEGSSYLLKVNCGGSENYYKWYKNDWEGISQYPMESSQYWLTNFNAYDEGYYHCKVTNGQVWDLTLKSEPVYLLLNRESCNPNDSLALVAFYNATDGPNWTVQWDFNARVNTWHGVKLKNERVSELSLSNNNLTGTIPAEIKNLTELRILNLNRTQISGSIPSEIGQLTKLEGLYLYNNQLTGQIPAEISQLSSLSELYLRANQLTGQIPSEIGNLSGLTYLGLHENKLSGEIPSSIGNLSNLNTLALYLNNISGTIPSEIGNLSGLTYLGLYENNLSGELPRELGRLINLTYLGLFGNNFSGELPDTLGNLVNLEILTVRNNNFSGRIPEAIGNLPKLYAFRIEDNNYIHSNIEPIFNWDNYSYLTNFAYSPQDSIGINRSVTIAPGRDYTLKIAGYSSSPNDSYRWFKNGTEIPGASSLNYIIPSISVEDEGTYYCEVMNSVTSDLTLFSRELKIIVNDVNLAPVADAGEDRTVSELETIVLDGSASYDANDDNLTYRWILNGGFIPAVQDDSRLTVLVSPVNGDTTLLVQLIVNDGELDSEPAEVKITVRNTLPLLKLVARANGFVVRPDSMQYRLYKKEGDSYIKSDSEYTVNGDTIVYLAEPGTWIVSGRPVKTSGYLPTYVGDVTGWDDAEEISIQDGQPFYRELNLIASETLEGSYSVSGIIYQDSSTGQNSIFKSATLENQEVMSDVMVYLYRANEVTPLKVTWSDENGYYLFSNLPEGNYSVQVSIPGFNDSDKYEVALSEEMPEEVIPFVVNTSTGMVTDAPTHSLVDDALIYPNPTSGKVTIKMGTPLFNEVEVTVLNEVGAIIYKNQYKHPETIMLDLNTQVSGMYLVKIKSGEKTTVKKLLLNKY